MKPHARIVALAVACTSLGEPATAHVVAGDRVFPTTLTFDDPGTSDEATLPQFQWQQDEEQTTLYQFQWEYDKTITPNTALIYNQGYDILKQFGEPTHTGLQNAFLTAKWQAYTNGPHEFVVSLGVIREFGGNSRTVDVDGDKFGSTAPTIYAGKGLGDLPIGWLRPLAVTGELSYIIPDRRLNLAADNGGQPRGWSGGFSVQYSIPYLQSEVKNIGLPGFLSRLYPIVEVNWYSPAGGPATGFPATLMVAPGVIWLGDKMQVGVEALIPGNRAAGTHVGVIAQVHFMLDDLFPNSLGKPLLQW